MKKSVHEKRNKKIKIKNIMYEQNKKKIDADWTIRPPRISEEALWEKRRPEHASDTFQSRTAPTRTGRKRKLKKIIINARSTQGSETEKDNKKNFLLFRSWSKNKKKNK